MEDLPISRQKVHHPSLGCLCPHTGPTDLPRVLRSIVDCFAHCPMIFSTVDTGPRRTYV
ncbi:hypothetical protein PAXRUDRAFT_590297 [Paxillus rubicundulus Ve08.2h10]|uniref:Uncharacterized protein n=1 Tax=Paxillus rubicundulus Ve08.2h10 TaxID=930991 RepID=A0A0D0DLH6_9AGAM|nr:hypothetical protein PAXRUDRAFT_590297 [Paxillus rubicundulus Ve08.2h10]